MAQAPKTNVDPDESKVGNDNQNKTNSNQTETKIDSKNEQNNDSKELEKDVKKNSSEKYYKDMEKVWFENFSSNFSSETIEDVEKFYKKNGYKKTCQQVIDELMSIIIKDRNYNTNNANGNNKDEKKLQLNTKNNINIKDGANVNDNDIDNSSSNENMKILDFGCNNGIQLKFFTKYSKDGLYGIDINTKSIENGKKLFSDSNFHLSTSDGVNIQFKDRFFDVIFAAAVLKHIRYQDRAKIYKEFKRVGKYLIVFDTDHKNGKPEEHYGFTFYNTPFEKQLSDQFKQLHLIKFGLEICGLYKL